MKILYAADNRKSSYFNLKRFLDTFSSFYEIKVAAYSKSVSNLNADWNLDPLLDFINGSDYISFRSSNFKSYQDEVQSYRPDLIISDIEIFSSFIGLELNIPVWQVSPLLLYYGIKSNQEKLNIYKNYSCLFRKNRKNRNYYRYIVNNSDKRLVCSHISDLKGRPLLLDTYQWVRPTYHQIEKTDIIPGYSTHLSDYYYHNCSSIIEIDYADIESIVSSTYNIHHNLSSLTGPAPPFETSLNENVKFLSQHLKDVDI